MNFHVLSWLLFFLAPGGCPIYSINVSTLEVPTNDFQNELTLHTMLSSELRQYRNELDKGVTSKKRNFPSKLFKEMAKIARSSAPPVAFLGTNLFDSKRKTCFSMEELSLMSARRTMEQLVPKSFPNCLLTDSMLHMLIRYVNTVNRIVQEMSDEGTRRVPQRAFYDALGGYLRYYLVPAAQVSYYAGRLKLKSMQCLLKIKRQSYVVLNTNGNAWRSPAKDIMCQFKGSKIEPIELGSAKFEDGAASCSQLDQSGVAEDSDQGQMVVPLPQLEPVDSEGHLTNIFLPFRHRRIYNLRSPSCASVVVRFFKTVSSCHRFQGMSQANYNHKLLNWIRDNVHSHYIDEMFYPGLGGILQIQETLLHFKKEQDSKEDDKCCYATESRKVSRSAGNWQEDPEQSPEEEHSEVESAEQENVSSNDQEAEDCRECDSNNSLIWYIVGFLLLLLLIILLVIFCCMRRGKKRKDKTPFVPVDVEAPPSSSKTQKKPKRAKERNKAGDGTSPYYGEMDENRSTSSLNCQLNKKCLPTKFSSKKGNSYYRVIAEESSPQRNLVSVRSNQYDLSPSSEIEDRRSMQKQKHRQSQERKQRGQKEAESGQSRTTRTSVDRKNSSPLEREGRRANRVRIAETDDSFYAPRQHRKKPDETRSSRLRSGTASSPHTVRDTPSWETTFDDV